MVLNSFLSHVFEADAVVKPLCPLANRFCGCCVWAPAPFFCVWFVVLVVLLFPLAKRKSGWGICGSSWFGGLVCFFWFFYFDLPAHMDQLCPCTNVFSTAYAHVRTEP